MRLLVYIMIVFLPLFGCQTNRKAAKAERKAEKVQKQREKEAKQLYEAGLERHINSQSTETRARMKENRQRSEQWLKPKKKQPFYKRWFKKRR